MISCSAWAQTAAALGRPRGGRDGESSADATRAPIHLTIRSPRIRGVVLLSFYLFISYDMLHIDRAICGAVGIGEDKHLDVASFHLPTI